MNVINRYIGLELLRIFGLAVLVLTFLMCIGSLIKGIDYVARGASGALLAKSVLYIIPYMLTFTIPMALMVSVLLLFNRLSLDQELTAMMACGISMFQISSPAILIAIVLCGASVFNNCILAPASHFAERRLFATVELVNPIDILEEGRFSREFPGLIVYVGSRKGNDIKDVIFYELDGQKVKRKIQADSGTLHLEKDAGVLVVELFNTRIVQQVPGGAEGESQYVYSSTFVDRIDVSKLMNKKELTKNSRDLQLPELVSAVRHIQSTYPNLSTEDLETAREHLLFEIHQRLTLAFSCISFALLGIALGVRSKRKGASVGGLVGLMVIFVNYYFIILSESLLSHPEIHPAFIQWIPVLGGQLAGIWLIQRRN